MTRHSAGVPSVAGVVLSGGLRPDDRVAGLIAGFAAGGKPLPMFAVDDDTFDTARTAAEVEGPITAGNERKIAVALGLFEANVDLAVLEERINLVRSTVVTPVMFQHELIERAKRAGARIVLPEGTDDRVLEAADRLFRRKVCELTLLGSEAVVRQRLRARPRARGRTGRRPDVVAVVRRVRRALPKLRAHRGITLDQARDRMGDVSYFGTMMVHRGHRRRDGVGRRAHDGAHDPTGAGDHPHPARHVDRLQRVPDAARRPCASLRRLRDQPRSRATQLADIAISSADTAVLFGIEPRIAMLSYSTGESGSGADVDKVREATERVRALRPELMVEGPIQYDAAVDVGVARTKIPDSAVAGQATVFIFPDLNTGDNTDKAVQRSADAVAVGPVLQGLNRPVNDLSRGATVADIVNTVAITAIQPSRS